MNKTMSKTLFKTLLSTAIIFILAGCTVEINENAKHVKAYELKALDDYSTKDSKNIRWFIDAPNALTKEQRVYTALEAAQDCKEKNDANECTVHHLATLNGFSYGDMFYTILTLDKEDKTKIEVTDKKLSKQEYNIAYYYTKLRTTYKDKSPEEFKKVFYDVMVGKLNIPVEQLKLPRIQREEFIIE